jgi:aryl-alcohol dehydrogenase-like predicted oxidoreductase
MVHTPRRPQAWLPAFRIEAAVGRYRSMDRRISPLLTASLASVRGGDRRCPSLRVAFEKLAHNKAKHEEHTGEKVADAGRRANVSTGTARAKAKPQVTYDTEPGALESVVCLREGLAELLGAVTLRKRRLGSTGVEVSELGLGCMPMSWAYVGQATEEESLRVLHRALELGVTFFDTADVYGPFTNEDLVGRALGSAREGIVVGTKVGLKVGPTGGYPLNKDARPERIKSEVDGSLARLRTEALDLYYLHRVDPQVPLEESWGAMGDLVQQGKVRWLGLSEVSLDELQRAHAIHLVTALQSELSLWTRDHMGEILPWCARNDVAFVPYAPLGRGYLTGAITSGSFHELDFRSDNPRFTQDAIDKNRVIIDAVRQVAERHNATPAQIALAWVLAQGDHVIPIPGTKRVGYLEENVAAAQLQLSTGDLEELDSIPDSVASRY